MADVKNHLAFWAGTSAFFGSILAIGAIDILNPNDQLRFLGGVFIALFTGFAVYSKQKLDDEKQTRVSEGVINVITEGDKRIYSLELKGDPSELEHKQVVVFRVIKLDEERT
jgi:hypothetical protein